MAAQIQFSHGSSSAPSSDRDTLYLFGGVAMLIFGAGLLLSNPMVRRFLGQSGVGDFTESILPDVERYFRLRSM